MGRAPQQPRDREGDAALSAFWFPRPTSVDDLEHLEPSGDFDAAEIFALLVSPDALEWPHKVGVAAKSEGSGKSSTRLLASGGRVFKTNLAEVEPSRDVLRARVLATRARGARARVWHPSKTWALLRTSEGWAPLTCCRALRTLRSFEPLSRRLAGWTRMIELAFDAGRISGLGLDLNPANFAVEPQVDALYYLDDELYPKFEIRSIAFAIAARIPEEPDVEDEVWRSWGRSLREVLDTRSVPSEERRTLVEETLGYPLAEGFEPRRAALVEGLRAPRPRAPRDAARGEVVCVLADVHANLPALRAVLESARAAGATRYLFLGDAVGYGPHPRECVETLASLREAVFVKGNHDHAIATGRVELGMNRLARACAEWTRAKLGPAEVAWLASLPTEHRDDGWLAVHGAPRDPNRFLAYVYDLTYEENLQHLDEQGVPLCFHGHTHVALVHVALPLGPAKMAGVRELRLEPRWTALVNPGSVGQPRDGDTSAAFALWETRARRVTLERARYDLDVTMRDLESAGLPAELVSRLQQGR
jgi:diadenosine tetraphosphatase ApaH/serine/threonine PP2A family protein phosphatase